MIIHKATVLAVMISHISLPFTLTGNSHADSLSVTPQPLTASTQAPPAETAKDITDTESGEPPSTLPSLLVDPSVLITPTIGKSLATIEQERIDEEKRIEIDRQKAEAAKVAAEKAKKAKYTAPKRVEPIQSTQRAETPQIRASTQKQASSVAIIGKSNEQCVIYVRRITGNAKVRGYAGNLQSEGSVPRIGAAALERNVGHVSIVIAIDGEYLILHDTNWIPGSITQRRVHISTQRGYIY